MYISLTFLGSSAAGRVIRAVDSESLATHRCGFESRQGLWSPLESCDEGISSYLTDSRCGFTPSVHYFKHERAYEVILHQ